MRKLPISNEKIIKLIRLRLSKLEPRCLKIENESHRHVGHEAWNEGAQHYVIFIASEKFLGMNRVNQHRLILSCLQDLIPFPVHSIALTVHC